MKKVRALIVDDEPLARRRIARLLEDHEEVEVVGECASGGVAVEAMTELEPDLVFLDIQMPEKSGFEALAEAEFGRTPVVVFVTAHDEYALAAFEHQALDYLLKPFDDERFEQTLRRAIHRLEERETADLRTQLLSLLDVQERARRGAAELEARSTRPARIDRLVIREDDRIFFLKVEEIDYIEAADYLAKIHVGDEVHTIRESLTSLEEKLDPMRFVRIHRSTIVNLDRVQELQPWFHGAYAVLLEDGTTLKLSRSRRKQLQELLGQTF
ncbi:MAG: LytTR family DNA-binding domain-containing protein [Gemmatimonadota bacterium]|nr:LytTR family DNA-binding domain-containing protein [Gemmatimonadota bacterium]